MFGRKKKFLKYETFYRRSGEVGEEFEHEDNIWKILAVTGERLITDGVGGGYIDKALYCEHQCTVRERMKESIINLQKEVAELKLIVGTKQITVKKEEN